MTEVAGVVLPVTTPVTTPPEETVATPALPLLHVPPASVSLKVSVAPWHNAPAPVIADGKGFTVTVAVLEQPVAVCVKLISDVPPVVETPETSPPDVIVAMEGLILVHVPGVEASVSVVVAPLHIPNRPLIAAGKAFTVTVCVAVPEQPAL
jgi:hypothetical protein